MNSYRLNRKNLASVLITNVLFSLLIFLQLSSYQKIELIFLSIFQGLIIIIMIGVIVVNRKIQEKKIKLTLQMLSILQIAILAEIVIIIRSEMQLAIMVPLIYSSHIDEITFNPQVKFFRQVYFIIRIGVDKFSYVDSLTLLIQIIVSFYLGNQRTHMQMKQRNASISQYANLQKPSDLTSQKITIREDVSAVNEKLDIQSKRISILQQINPENDINYTKIIQHFPEGVAIINYKEDFEPYVKFQNDSINKLINLPKNGNLIKEIAKLEKLDRIKSNQLQEEKDIELVKDSFQTFKSFAFDAHDNQFLKQDRLTLFNQRGSNQVRGSQKLRPSTQLENLRLQSSKFNQFNANSEQDFMKQFYDIDNVFERVLYLAALTLFRQGNTLRDDELTLFAIFNGYIVVNLEDLDLNIDKIEQKNEERCVEIKIFLNRTKRPSLLLLARDVSHRDYIRLLKDQSKAKQNSLNFVSHEYRTPLNCIITMLENCEEDFQNKQIGDETGKQIQTALQNCYYILNLSNDLLDLAQMKVGKFQLQKSNFQLDRLLKQCISLFQPLADKKKINLELKYPEQYQSQICHDENRIKQIIINLLGNAFKFTIEGSITIDVKKLGRDALRILVSDTGIGIREEDKGRLMDAFGKIESDENKKLNRQGVGLGLLISNMIARSLNSRNVGLQFFSTYSQGSTFYFDIQYDIINWSSSNQLQSIKSINNFVQDESQDSIDSFKMSQTNNEPKQPVYVLDYHKNFKLNQVPKKIPCQCSDILIVDDIQFNIEALILLLNKFGYKKIDFVICGQFAIDKVQEKMQSDCCKFYKLIFMDIEMPGIDGFQTFKEISNILGIETHNTKVVACSGYSSQTEKEKAIQWGMHGYLEKPLKKKELEKLLQLI